MSSGKIKNEIGQRIKNARKSVGLSQKQLANVLKISDKAISSYEIGRTQPSFTTLKRISQAVQKSITYFDEGETDTKAELDIKLRIIEKELAEIKKLLQKNQDK